MCLIFIHVAARIQSSYTGTFGFLICDGICHEYFLKGIHRKCLASQWPALWVDAFVSQLLLKNVPKIWCTFAVFPNERMGVYL